MILNDTIEIKIHSNTINYWKNKSPKYQNVSIGNTVTVSVHDLPSKSNIMIDCVCDSCKRRYSQRRSRNLNFCGYCITSNRMKNNKLGSKNVIHVCPDVSRLKTMIEQNSTKKEICSYFNINYIVLNRWLKKHDLTIMPYKGNTIFDTEKEQEEAIVKVRILLEQGKSIADIIRDTGFTRQVSKTLIQKTGLTAMSKFDVWKKQYDEVIENFESYVVENRTKTLLEISNDHNISVEQLKKAFRDNGVNPKIHSYNKSKGEIECRDFIRSLGLSCDSYKFEKKYEIDCFVPSKKFGLEYCGEFWHQYSPSKKNKMYHKEKTTYFENCGIQLMTIFESEWKSNKRQLLESMIKTRLGMIDNRVFARKCMIKQINKQEADAFHIKNHISGKTTSSKNYGLYYDDSLVSVLSLIKSRFDKNYEYEIARFSSVMNTVVVGGLSRLFKYFVQQENPVSCMSYADYRFGQGLSYMKLGFTCEGITPPNYHYFNKNTDILESRMKYQKSKLTHMPEYDPNKTEFQIMMDAGYYVIYDCGSKKYGWKNPTHIK
jgi:DNA-binding phage protein